MVETAMVGMKKTDGSIVFVSKEVHTPFITLETPNTAPSGIGLEISAIPLISGSLKNGQVIGTLNCTDLESGNNCFYTTSDTRFSIIGNQILLASA